jgi:hypothetical protein
LAKKPNYNFEKSRKEQERKRKKEEKRRRKLENSENRTPESSGYDQDGNPVPPPTEP